MSNAAGHATRRRLIIAAERLFAERGFDAVPLASIAEAAGQRNVAAANYYFGDRDGVLRAIWDYRLPQVVERQQELLDKVRGGAATSRDDRMRSLLRAFVIPLAEQIRVGHFIGFLSRLQTDLGRVDRYVDERWMRLTQEIFLEMRSHCRETGPRFENRAIAIGILTVHMLATRQLLIGRTEGFLSEEECLSDLIAIQQHLISAENSGVHAE